MSERFGASLHIGHQSVMSRRKCLRWGSAAALGGLIAPLIPIVIGERVLAQDAAYTVIRAVRLRLGDGDSDLPGEPDAPHEGTTHEETFDCPNVDSSAMAVLMFESYDIDWGTSQMLINGTRLSAALRATPEGDMPKWIANTVLVDSGILQSRGNVLRIEALDENGGTGDREDFILDNIVIMYTTN